MEKFLGLNVVETKGLPEDRVSLISIDHGLAGGDETAVVMASLQEDGRWRVDNVLSGKDACEAFGRAMIGLRPIKEPRS